MTFKDLEEIKSVIVDNPNKKAIDKAKEYYNILNMHVNGVGMDAYIEKITEYENEQQRAVRKRLRESNKGLYSTLLNPINKVFSAKGGSKLYKVSEANKPKIKDKVHNVSDGLSINKWIEKKILNKYIVDPSGIVLMEVSNNETKPTYQGINTIYDYPIKNTIDYIVFMPFTKDDEENTKYYRVIDDTKDYLIKATEKEEDITLEIVKDETYINHFGYVPATVISDIYHNVDDIRASFIDETLEKASKFFFDNSVHTVHKLLHGFAKYWEYGRDCMNCNGTGVVQDEDNNSIACPICSGTGDRPNGDVSDKLIVPFPNEGDSIITKFSGFESPDIDIWKQYKEDLKDHQSDLFFMLWNTTYTNNKKNETATGRFLDVQPLNEKLYTISDNVDRLEKFITDAIGQFYFERDYKGSSINGGRRYLLESPDAIWDKLSKAIIDKMPTAFILDLSKEYIESKYSNNSLEIDIQLKMLDIEPFTFLTIKEVIDLGVSDDDVKRKLFFKEWYSTKSEAELLLNDRVKLTEDLNKYIINKEFTRVPQNQN